MRDLERLQRALGQQLGDGRALHADLDVRRDLDRCVLVGELRDLADDPPGGVVAMFGAIAIMALAPWLDRLSMFDVFAAPWFAAIYLLLCISLAGCIIPRTFDQLRALRRKPPAAPARLDRMQGLQQLTVGAEPDAVAEAAASQALRWWCIATLGTDLL